MIKNINVPEKLNDITLKQYQLFQGVISDKEITDDLKNRSALFIFYGVNNKLYDNMRAKDVKYLVDELNKVFADKHEFIQRFTHKSVEYGFIPSLDDISFGELVDLDKYTDYKDYHRLMSILYRPVTKRDRERYDITTYTGTNEELQEMPLGIVLGAVGFFLTLGFQLLNCTLKSLKLGNKLTLMQILEKSGIGTEAFTPWQTKI